jgi:hypothetical protein
MQHTVLGVMRVKCLCVHCALKQIITFPNLFYGGYFIFLFTTAFETVPFFIKLSPMSMFL